MTPWRHRDTFATLFRVQRFTLLDDIQYERINVVGTSGSGKSSLSRQIATHLDLPYIELDQLFWKTNWTETPDEEFFRKLRVALSANRWVLDGNYDRTRQIKWSQVQTVVWLDLPLYLVFSRVLVRTLTRSLTGKELWAGNKETFRKTFLSRDSIILWSLTTHAKNRKRYATLSDNDRYRHIRFIRLRSTKEVDEFVNNLTS
ncbi:MAG: adenylate kinase [Pseudomonadales bacterium]|nr:adenylate kinase [Pseudomonadales bacterium]